MRITKKKTQKTLDVLQFVRKEVFEGKKSVYHKNARKTLDMVLPFVQMNHDA
jgi:hypothetical protein